MKKLIIAMGLAVVTAASASANSAYLQISDNNGNSTVLFTSPTGFITFNGVLGNWDINFDSGVANPPSGGQPVTAPDLDLSFQNRFTGGAGNVLTITFYADGLGPISGSMHQVFGGTVPPGMTDQADLMINGVSKGTQSSGPNLTLTTQPFGLIGDFAVNAAANSTVGITLTLTATQAGITSGDVNLTTNVPDAGMTLALLGSALTGLALFARNRKTA